MKDIISVGSLAVMCSVSRSFIHQLIDGRRIFPDYVSTAGDGTKFYFFKPDRAAEFAQQHKEQKEKPRRNRRVFGKSAKIALQDKKEPGNVS